MTKQCPLCYAPEGKPHASKCPRAQQHTDVLTKELYPDSPNGASFSDGMQFQDWVVERMSREGFYIQLYSSRYYQYHKGESIQKCEIKLDNRCTDTGRLSIEVAEKSRASIDVWTPSGIKRNDNTIFYVQGNTERLYLFAKKDLLLYLETRRPELAEFPPDGPTIRRFFLPFAEADRMCLFFITSDDDSSG